MASTNLIRLKISHSRMTCNQNNTFEGLILCLSYIYLQDGATTTITGLQYCSSSQLTTGTTGVGWGRPFAASEQDYKKLIFKAHGFDH